MLGAHRQPRPLIQRPSRQNVESYASHLGHSSVKAAGEKKAQIQRRWAWTKRGRNAVEVTVSTLVVSSNLLNLICSVSYSNGHTGGVDLYSKHPDLLPLPVT